MYDKEFPSGEFKECKVAYMFNGISTGLCTASSMTESKAFWFKSGNSYYEKETNRKTINTPLKNITQK